MSHWFVSSPRQTAQLVLRLPADNRNYCAIYFPRNRSSDEDCQWSCCSQADDTRRPKSDCHRYNQGEFEDQESTCNSGNPVLKISCRVQRGVTCA